MAGGAPWPSAGRRIVSMAEGSRRRWRSLRTRRVLGIRGLGAVLLGAGVLALAGVALVVVGFLHARSLDHRIQRLATSIQAAQVQAESGQLSAAVATIDADEAELIGINHSLDSSPDLRLLSLAPVARQNLHAVRDAARLGTALLDDARLIVTAAAPDGHLHLSLQGGHAPLQTIQAIRATLDQIIPTLPTSPTPPARSWLVGPVTRARDKLWAEAAKRRHELVSIDDALGVLEEITGAGGPRRYLLAVANTAEMRGAGGMILNYGVLNASGGHVSLGSFGDIDKLALRHPAPVGFPADYTSFFASYRSNLLWRNATIMSDFTIDAPVLQSMYQTATGQHVDGVLQIDPVGLSAILAGVGPIQDPVLGTLTAANVAPIVLNEAYLRFPDRTQRQGFVGNVAKEAFAALTSRPLVNLAPLINGLAAVTADRHIVMWSSTPGVEQMVHGLGADGSLPAPGTSFTQLAVENVGGNKMDYYVETALQLAGTAPSATRPGSITATIGIANPVPPGMPASYVFGPEDASSGDPPGVYHGLVTLYLPAGAMITSATPQPGAAGVFVNQQGGLTAVTFTTDLHPKTSTLVTVTAVLPPAPASPGTIRVVPTPRPLPTLVIEHLARQKS